MIVIADSGSTKTQWVMIEEGEMVKQLSTSGINPYFESSDTIIQMLATELSFGGSSPSAVYFYGAGCANEKINKVVEDALHVHCGHCEIHIESDLYAAARSLCQKQKGIACIIGTGSNSCLYDGQTIIENVSPLGFILGDEGSGAVLGRTLVGDILKKQLDASLTEAFFKQYQTTAAEIVDRVYRQPFPNRYLAQFTKFIHTHIDHPQMRTMVNIGFERFITRNLMQYPNAHSLPVSFTGSVAFHFRDLLSEALQQHNLTLGKIDKTPIEGLVRYHLNVK